MKKKKRKQADGDKAVEEGQEFSDEDEQARFLALMNKHASPGFRASKLAHASGSAALTAAAATVSMSELKAQLKPLRAAAKFLEQTLCAQGFDKGAAKAVVARFGTAAEVLRAAKLAGAENLVSVADMKSFRGAEARRKLLECCARIEKGVDEERERDACRENLRRSLGAGKEGSGSDASREAEAGPGGRAMGREVWLRWSKELQGLMRAEGALNELVEGHGVKSESCAGREARSKGWVRMRCQRKAGGELSQSTPVLVVRFTGDVVVEQMFGAADKVGDGASAAQVALECARSMAERVREVISLTREQGSVEDERGLAREMVLVVIEGLWTACKKAQRKGTQTDVVRRLAAESDYARLYLSVWGPRLLGGPDRDETWQVVCSANRNETVTALQAVVAVVHAQALLLPTAKAPT